MSTGMLGMLPLSAVQGPRDTLDQNLAGDDGQLILNTLKKFNRREPCWMPRTVKIGHMPEVTLTERHDPDVFCRGVPNMEVCGAFKHWIVADAGPTEVGAMWSDISRHVVITPASGEGLRTENPRSIWSATDFCAWIHAVLGQSGRGLATDASTLFLVEGIQSKVSLVRVYHYKDRWTVNLWASEMDWQVGSHFVPRR